MAPRKRESKSSLAAEQLRGVLAGCAREAVEVLAQIMRDDGQKAELRMKAAESILDRACGKATAAQPAEATQSPPVTVVFQGELEEWSG